MKSRVTVFLLLAAAVAVWGVVAWKILAPASGRTTPETEMRPAPQPLPRVADTLFANYPDPFLKGAVQEEAVARPALRGLPPVQQLPKRRAGVRIAHWATVAAAGGEPRYILSIEDEQYEVRRGDAAGEFVLTGADRDSLYLRRKGVVYGVKRCE